MSPRRLSLALVFGLAGCYRSGNISFFFEEVEDTATIEGVVLSADEDEDVSNRRGKATVAVPEAGDFELVATADGRPTHHLFLSGTPGYWEFIYSLTTTADVEEITAALGVDYDPSLGIVEVNGAWTDGNWMEGMPGATFDLDVDYGAAVLGDPGSEVGWKLGNSLQAGDARSMVAFVNVPVGEFSVSVTLPEEEASCGAFPSESEGVTDRRFSAAAGEVTAIIILCTRASDAQARAVPSQPGLSLDLDPPTRADGALRLSGRLDAGALGRASYTVSATPPDAPTRVLLDVSQPDGGALTLDERIDTATATLDLGRGALSYAALPDGTYALDDLVLDSEPALLRALLADARLAELTEPMLLGWIHALAGLADAAPTRFQVSCDGGLNKVRMVHTPTWLGCLRFGEDSMSCQLGRSMMLAQRRE